MWAAGGDGTQLHQKYNSTHMIRCSHYKKNMFVSSRVCPREEAKNLKKSSGAHLHIVGAHIKYHKE
jgi:hypothetical protein